MNYGLPESWLPSSLNDVGGNNIIEVSKTNYKVIFAAAFIGSITGTALLLGAFYLVQPAFVAAFIKGKTIIIVDQPDDAQQSSRAAQSAARSPIGIPLNKKIAETFKRERPKIDGDAANAEMLSTQAQTDEVNSRKKSSQPSKKAANKTLAKKADKKHHPNSKQKGVLSADHKREKNDKKAIKKESAQNSQSSTQKRNNTKLSKSLAKRSPKKHPKKSPKLKRKDKSSIEVIDPDLDKTHDELNRQTPHRAKHRKKTHRKRAKSSQGIDDILDDT